MKKLLALFVVVLFTGPLYSQTHSDSNIDPDIIGGWEYFKSVDEDGTEIVELVAIEHYYADGKVIYVGMWHSPFSLGALPENPEELKEAFKEGLSGLGTYTTDQEGQIIHFKLTASADSTLIGNTFEVPYKIIGDTLIWHKRYYAVRIKE